MFSLCASDTLQGLLIENIDNENYIQIMKIAKVDENLKRYQTHLNKAGASICTLTLSLYYLDIMMV